ncbi:unnamed protein product [Diamesa hyperborea]
MNLDLDDPLGDLLSDGSNDSFFGIEPAKKQIPKKETKEEKPFNKMEQLFGITEENTELTTRAKTSELKLFGDDSSSLLSNITKRPNTALFTEPLKVPVSKQPITNLEDQKSNDSITSDLGFDPKKHRKKSTNILDEILGIGDSKSSAYPAKSIQRENPSKATISRQTTSETISENINLENASGYTPSNARKSGRRQSAVVFSDPLGLFGPNEKEKEIINKVSKTARKSIAGTEWLLGDSEKVPHLTKLKSSPAIQVTANSEDRIEIEPSSNITSMESKSTLPTTIYNSSSKNPQLMENINTETNNSLNNLKQQEFQLMVASQMKVQENVLVDMKNKQQELLNQQERQFNELLKKQITRQSELEDVIKQQQDRINSHIQALMASHSQPPYMEGFAVTGVSNDKTTNDAENSPIAKIELESEVKCLEMEKLRLEDLLANVHDNHEKEILMIEQSYKKRILIMEENLQSIECRYKDEIKSMDKFFTDKIGSMNIEKENTVSNFENKIKLLEESHQHFIDKLKKSYDTDLDMLKKHYEEMMENIRKSKIMEFAIKEESSSYMDVLKRASNNLETASGDIQSLHDVLQEKMMVLERDKEIQLSNREKRLEEQQKLLERTRDMSETERNKLLDLVQTLEVKLNSIEQKSDEEQWSLKQKLNSFDVEKMSFQKEKEYQRSQMSIEQQRVQELKESQLNEYAKLIKAVEDERLKLQEQKAQIEVSKQLQNRNSSETGISRAEIDAAVRYADDAAKESDKERERLIEIQRQCEAKKREMIDQESLLRTKQVELDMAINQAKQKERAAENLLKNTKKTEHMLMAKYQSLQKYTMELSERETKTAKERLQLKQEMLQLQSQRRKLFESRCSLCKIGEKANELKGIIQKDPIDFDDINNGANIEQTNNEIFNLDKMEYSFGSFFNHDMNLLTNLNIDLDNVPNLTDMSDDLLDSDLLMLKLNVMNSGHNMKDYK